MQPPAMLAVDEGLIAAWTGGGSGIAAPGFVDLQVRLRGVDVASALRSQDLESMSVARACDALAYQPTLISGDPGDPAAAVACATNVASRRPLSVDMGAFILGAHLEGPFLSSSRAGTHPLELSDPHPRSKAARPRPRGPTATCTSCRERSSSQPG